MPSLKKIDVSGILSLFIFVSAMVGLSIIYDISESYSISLETKKSDMPITEQDDIVKALNDMDANLVIFFSDLKDELGFL